MNGSHYAIHSFTIQSLSLWANRVSEPDRLAKHTQPAEQARPSVYYATTRRRNYRSFINAKRTNLLRITFTFSNNRVRSTPLRNPTPPFEFNEWTYITTLRRSDLLLNIHLLTNRRNQRTDSTRPSSICATEHAEYVTPVPVHTIFCPVVALQVEEFLYWMPDCFADCPTLFHYSWQPQIHEWMDDHLRKSNVSSSFRAVSQSVAPSTAQLRRKIGQRDSFIVIITTQPPNWRTNEADCDFADDDYGGKVGKVGSWRLAEAITAAAWWLI